MPDPHDLARFVEAQDDAGTYDDAVGELRAGRKTSHWMWFVFPQIAGLGHSATSRTYAIASLAEARRTWSTPSSGRVSSSARASWPGMQALRRTRSSARPMPPGSVRP